MIPEGLLRLQSETWATDARSGQTLRRMISGPVPMEYGILDPAVLARYARIMSLAADGLHSNAGQKHAQGTSTIATAQGTMGALPAPAPILITICAASIRPYPAEMKATALMA